MSPDLMSRHWHDPKVRTSPEWQATLRADQPRPSERPRRPEPLWRSIAVAVLAATMIVILVGLA